MVEVRSASNSELTEVLAVHERAFGRPSEARLVALLHQAGKVTISLVAVHDANIVASIVFSPVGISGERAGISILGLAPVSVLPEHQNRGIGSALIREGLRQCALAGHDAVVVLGDPRYYSRFGFSRAADHGLGNECGAHDEFMLMELKEGALDGVRGLVQYQPEFQEVD